jgi:threonine dehydrogenase-like Zn-dependent dehydrogenase
MTLSLKRPMKENPRKAKRPLGPKLAAYQWAETHRGVVQFHRQRFPVQMLTNDAIVVRPLYAGICRADIKEASGLREPIPGTRHLFGHEVIGKVVFAGAATGFEEEQTVTLNPNADCERTTAFGNYLVAHGPREALHQALVRIPEHVSLEPPWLPEPFACVIHSLDGLLLALGTSSLAGVEVAIVGAGNAGVLFGLYCQHLRGRATLFNRSPPRREFAQRLGSFPDDRICPLDSAPDAAFDVVVLATTIIDEDILRIGERMVSPRGALLLYGGTWSNLIRDGHDLNQVRRTGSAVSLVSQGKAIRVVGGYGCTAGDFERALGLYAEQPCVFPLSRFISATIGLDDLPKTITGMASGAFDPPGKILIRIAEKVEVGK